MQIKLTYEINDRQINRKRPIKMVTPENTTVTAVFQFLY